MMMFITPKAQYAQCYFKFSSHIEIIALEVGYFCQATFI